MERTLEFEIAARRPRRAGARRDPDRLSQMLENLLSNAAPATASAPATVAVSSGGRRWSRSLCLRLGRGRRPADAGAPLRAIRDGRSGRDRARPLHRARACPGTRGRRRLPAGGRRVRDPAARLGAFVTVPLATTGPRPPRRRRPGSPYGMLRTALRLHGGFEVVGEAQDRSRSCSPRPLDRPRHRSPRPGTAGPGRARGADAGAGCSPREQGRRSSPGPIGTTGLGTRTSPKATSSSTPSLAVLLGVLESVAAPPQRPAGSTCLATWPASPTRAGSSTTSW